MGIEEEFSERLEQILSDPAADVSGEVRRFLELSLLASQGLFDTSGGGHVVLNDKGEAGFRIHIDEDPVINMLAERHDALQDGCLRLAREVDALRRQLKESIG